MKSTGQTKAGQTKAGQTKAGQTKAGQTKSAPKKTATKSAAAKKPAATKKAVAPKKPTAKPAAKKSVAPKKATGKTVASSKSAKPKTSKPKLAAPKPAANDPRRLDLLKMVEKSLDADKAEEIVHFDLAEKSAIADFMVIATGRNTRQLAAMAQHVAEKLTKAGVKSISIEGLSQGDWVLVDGGDIIVHLFRPEIRTLYGLEKMWGVTPPTPETLQAVG